MNKLITATAAVMLMASAASADISFNNAGISGTVNFDADGTYTGISNCMADLDNHGESNSWTAGYWAKNTFADNASIDLNDALQGWTNYYAGKDESEWNGWMGARLCYLAHVFADDSLDTVITGAGGSNDLVVEIAHDLYTTGEEEWEELLAIYGVSYSGTGEQAIWNAYVQLLIDIETGEAGVAFPFTPSQWDSYGTSYGFYEMTSMWALLDADEKQAMLDVNTNYPNYDKENWAADVEVMSYTDTVFPDSSN